MIAVAYYVKCIINTYLHPIYWFIYIKNKFDFAIMKSASFIKLWHRRFFVEKTISTHRFDFLFKSVSSKRALYVIVNKRCSQVRTLFLLPGSGVLKSQTRIQWFKFTPLLNRIIDGVGFWKYNSTKRKPRNRSEPLKCTYKK